MTTVSVKENRNPARPSEKHHWEDKPGFPAAGRTRDKESLQGTDDDTRITDKTPSAQGKQGMTPSSQGKQAEARTAKGSVRAGPAGTTGRVQGAPSSPERHTRKSSGSPSQWSPRCGSRAGPGETIDHRTTGSDVTPGKPVGGRVICYKVTTGRYLCTEVLTHLSLGSCLINLSTSSAVVVWKQYLF